MEKRFSREKYLECTISNYLEDLSELEGYIKESRLLGIHRAYTTWAKECDGLTINECKNIGYSVDYDEWLTY